MREAMVERSSTKPCDFGVLPGLPIEIQTRIFTLASDLRHAEAHTVNVVRLRNMCWNAVWNVFQDLTMEFHPILDSQDVSQYLHMIIESLEQVIGPFYYTANEPYTNAWSLYSDELKRVTQDRIGIIHNIERYFVYDLWDLLDALDSMFEQNVLLIRAAHEGNVAFNLATLKRDFQGVLRSFSKRIVHALQDYIDDQVCVSVERPPEEDSFWMVLRKLRWSGIETLWFDVAHLVNHSIEDRLMLMDVWNAEFLEPHFGVRSGEVTRYFDRYGIALGTERMVELIRDLFSIIFELFERWALDVESTYTNQEAFRVFRAFYMRAYREILDTVRERTSLV